ncbi:MAG: hypothetical protein FJ349_09525 [Sphingomonadales bacterium]|nr:hypothetical protein [Sphingomonadales bacterium]
MARTRATGTKTTRRTSAPERDPGANRDSSTSDDEEKEDDPEDLETDAAGDYPPIELLERNEVTNFYRYTLGFSPRAARSLYLDQGLHDSSRIIKIGTHETVDKLCKIVGKATKTVISLQAQQNLAMLVYYFKHLERTSRAVPILTNVFLSDIEALDHHRTVEEERAKTHRDPDPTSVTLDGTSAAKAFNQMRQILTNMRGVSKVPLAYVIRTRILPPDSGGQTPNLPYGYVDSPYASHEDEMIQRAPILAENREEWHNLRNLETLEDTGARHLTFNADNRTVFQVLFSYWGRNPAWTNVRSFTRQTDGRAAYRALYRYFFGTNSVQTQTKSVLSNLSSFKYDECRKNFTFETYVLKHIEQHNLHNELVEHGADPLNEDMKIHYFQSGITNRDFDSVKNAVLATPENFQTFDRVKDQFMSFHRNRPTSDGPVRTRAIASIRGRGGRGPRHPYPRRDGGVPPQIAVDRCTHIQDRTYTKAEYDKLSAAEKQRLYQIRKEKNTRNDSSGRPRSRDNRSISSAMTDQSSSRKTDQSTPRKRSATEDSDSYNTDDNASLFGNTDQDIKTDKRAKNRANARQET